MLDPRDVPDLAGAPLVLDTDGDGRLDTNVVDDGARAGLRKKITNITSTATAPHAG